MNENHISNFLERFKKILFKKDEELQIISQILSKHLAITIDPKNIKIKGIEIQLKASPALRNEVLIHKTGILSDINNLMPERNFKNIN